MKGKARAVAWHLAPQRMADRAVRWQEQLAEHDGRRDGAARFVAEHGRKVMRGPLTGAVYLADGDSAIAKIIGAYECEIQPWLAEALDNHPAMFVDVGAADGYYAVGVAATQRDLPVCAFELSPIQRERLATLAREVGATIDLRAHATARSLGALDLAKAFVLMDIEGAEIDVLAPSVVAEMSSCTVVVELHEVFRPGVTETLRQRFSPSHTMDIVTIGERRSADFPEADGWGTDVVDESMRVDGFTFARFVPRS